ncbi:MAG: bifunctional nuclease family protein [Thermoprotei archaeon]|jgi:bifunctional DNase/RNase|nr:bifunctional nuclease family protein [Thermoprotei archaeon]
MVELEGRKGKVMYKTKYIESYLASEDPLVPVLTLFLENGEELELYNVPLEIAKFVADGIYQNNSWKNSERATIFDLLWSHEDIVNLLKEDIEYILIDEFDEKTMLYSAKVVFKNGGVVLERRFVPSHAIFLALITGKDIFVSSEIINNKRGSSQD